MSQLTASARTLFVVSLLVLSACSERHAQAPTTTENSAPRPVVSGSGAAAALPDFSRLVEEYGPAVVNVEIVQQQRRVSAQDGAPADDPLQDFFRRFGIPMPGGAPQGEQGPAHGSGSGFIVTADGYILTNAHVVSEADDVTVRLTDRREFPAKVIGADTRTDVAVIKIDAKNLPTVRMGDPAALKPGQWVLAIGSPFGLENSATAGIVSATARAVGGETYVPFIQTDVAVNPGNSGGPLFNLSGEVVGINSMIFSRTGGYMGLSFAIPIDVAINVRDQLIKTGHVVRGRIGVAVQDVNAQLSQSFGLDRPRGALVNSVEPKGPAAQAGLKPGDVILAVNEHPIERVGDLSSTVAALKPGSNVPLHIWRDGKDQTLNVRIAEAKDEQPTTTAAAHESEESAALGLAVRPLSDEEKRRVQTEGNLVVAQVGGPAAIAGVQPGDVILGVNGKKVASVDDLRTTVKQTKGSVALLLQRGDAQVFIPVRKR